MIEAYISATFEDLKDCRLAVQNALDRLKIAYRTMEAYSAESRPPLSRCLDDISACDIYIGIFAWRYGFRPPGEEKSITHLEYDHAVATGKPCLIFLHDPAATWPVRFVDRGPDAAAVDGLRQLLSQEYLCNFFDSPDRLALHVVSAVTNYVASREAAPAEPQAATGERLSADALRLYLDTLCQQYGRLDLDALSVQQPDGYRDAQLSSVFVEPYVREEQPPEVPGELRRRIERSGLVDESELPDDLDPGDLIRSITAYRDKPLRLIFDVLGAEEGRRVVLLGDPGSGKSAVVRYLALGLAGAYADDRLAALEGHLPIMVELRSYAAAAAGGVLPTFQSYLEHRAGLDGYRLHPLGLQHHLDRGEPAVVVFDGLDEILDPRQRENAAAQIAAFAAEFPAARIIVTSRLPEYQRRILAGAGFAHHTLQNLDAMHTSDFLGRWYRLALPDRPADAALQRDLVFGAIQQSPALVELSGNPMLLSILAMIGRNQMLPKQRWQLYRRAANVLVERWDHNRRLVDAAGEQTFDADDKRAVLRRLAYDMQFGRVGVNGTQVDSDELKRIFAEYLEEHNNLDTTAANKAAVALITQLRERNFILSRSGSHVYGFVHRTFLDYFCASSILRKFQHSHEWTFEDLQSMFRERWSDPAWHEVLRLVAGELHPRQTAQLVELLVQEANPSWPPSSGRTGPPPWNLALAVQCLAAVRPLSQAARAAGVVLHQLIRLVEYCATTHDPESTALLGDEIIPAVEMIGASWPTRQSYLDWYLSTGLTLVINPPAAYAARIAAMTAQPADRLDDVLIDLTKRAGDVRVVCAATAGLGEMVRRAARPDRHSDAGPARSRLAEAAAGDERAVVRLAAVQALGAAAGSDPVIRSVLLTAAEKDGYSEVRLMAVRGLSEHFRADPEVDRTLLVRQQSDGDAAVRTTALRALVRDRQLRPEVVDSLLRACRTDRHAEVVELAARALLPRPAVAAEVREVLLGRLTGGSAPGLRRAVIRLLNGPGHDEHLVRCIAEDPDAQVVREAAVALTGRRNGPHDRVRDALTERFQGEADEVVRGPLIRILNETSFADRRTEDVIVEAATGDREPPVRLTAVQVLATHPPSDRRRALFAEVAVKEAVPSVRLAAVAGLARDPDSTATEVLVGVATVDADVNVKVAALDGLAGRRLDEAGAARVVALTDGGNNAQVRLAALEALVASETTGVDLTEVFHDRTANDSVGEVFAAAAVAAVSNPGGAARLWPVIADRANSDPNPQVRSAAVKLLGSAAGFVRSAEVLRERLRRDADPEVVGEAARAIAAITPGDARPLLLERLSDPDPAIRGAVVRLLAPWVHEDDVRARLIDQARSPDSNEVRRAAVEVLTPLAGRDDVRFVLAELLQDQDFAVRAAAARLLGRPVSRH